MDRKLRATRLKLEQQRQATFKRDRDLAKATNKKWNEVEKSFFKRLSRTNGPPSPTKRAKEEENEERKVRMRRTIGGKAALELQRRSANGFNSLCFNATIEFNKYDLEKSNQIELLDIPKLLETLQYVPIKPPIIVSINNKSKNNDDDISDNDTIVQKEDWFDNVSKQVDKNGDGSVHLKDFISWWTSQCPTCVPLRGCYPEINIDVRRIALDEDGVKWMAKENSQELSYLLEEYERWKEWKIKEKENGSKNNTEQRPQIPMVCDSCWNEYKRATFVEEYDERNDHMKYLERIRQSARGSASSAAKHLGSY
jgi:hypothetical protein